VPDDAQRTTDPLLEAAAANRGGRVWQYDGTKGTEREVSEFIAALVQAVKPDVVVETGTFLGHTMHVIAAALELNGRGHLHTVENDSEMVEQVRSRLPERVTLHEADSSEWCERFVGPVDIAFVDSGPGRVRLEDVRALWPKIAPGGYLTVHDTIYYKRLLARVSELVGVEGIEIRSLLGLGIWQKPAA
jgi:predicted O-methyltransferase YrrM